MTQDLDAKANAMAEAIMHYNRMLDKVREANDNKAYAYDQVCRTMCEYRELRKRNVGDVE